MDCPSEENLIRMKLMEVDQIKHLEFNIENRELVVYHKHENYKNILDAISELKLGEKLISSNSSEKIQFESDKNQSNLLWKVLTINFLFFLIESITGIISNSIGLIADSLDMLADSFVYGISLLAVGGSVFKKKKIAKLAGYFQIFLATIGFIEVIRRTFMASTTPDYITMIIISLFALIGNTICLVILQKSKSKEAHMQASMIFTSNDIIINIGVILAGVMVWITNSKMPDLLIGTIVFILVLQGAFKILKLAK